MLEGVKLVLGMSFCAKQEALDNSGEFCVKNLQEKLYKKLICPICHDLIQNASANVKCLHRFCSHCIFKYFDNKNRECPTCGQEIESERNLRQDPKFDALVKLIFPDRYEFETLQKGVAEKNVLDTCVKSSNSEKREIEIVLTACRESSGFEPCTDISQLSRYLKVFDNATIDHLTEYLAIRADLERSGLETIHRQEWPGDVNLNQFKIFMQCKEMSSVKPLNGTSTLREVINEYEIDDEPLKLYYQRSNF